MTTLLTFSPAHPSLTFSGRKKKQPVDATAPNSNGPAKDKTNFQDTAAFNKIKTEELRQEQQKKEEAELEAQKAREAEHWQTFPGGAPSGSSGRAPLTADEIAEKEQKKAEKERLRKAKQKQRKKEEKARTKASPFVVPASNPVDEAARARVESELTRTDLVEEERAIAVGQRDKAQEKLVELLTDIAPHRVAFSDRLDKYSGLKLLDPDLRFKLIIESKVQFPILKRVFAEHCQGDLKKFEREYKRKGEALFEIYNPNVGFST